ncbi:hypothetical protein HanIR_Chr17g0862531 [Helianthus annuus]|nr:hypothetical protein HanIR_Chr17g0862531 [Helianthus annuus]
MIVVIDTSVIKLQTYRKKNHLKRTTERKVMVILVQNLNFPELAANAGHRTEPAGKTFLPRHAAGFFSCSATHDNCRDTRHMEWNLPRHAAGYFSKILFYFHISMSELDCMY